MGFGKQVRFLYKLKYAVSMNILFGYNIKFWFCREKQTIKLVS